MYRRLAISSAFSALFALLLLAAPAATAQTAAPGTDVTDRIRSQIVSMLTSDQPEMQKQGISLIQQYAEQDDPRVKPEYFADRLTRMYFDRDQDDDVRVQALDALYAMDRLETRVARIVQNLRSDPSEAVRAHTLRVLSEYNKMG
jgi:hypothetical protein